MSMPLETYSEFVIIVASGQTDMDLVINLIILVAFVAGDWMIVKKSGRNPWNIFIPVYNILLHLDIAGLRRRWLIYATTATFALAFLFSSLFGSNWYAGLGLTGEDAVTVWLNIILIPPCIKIAKNFGRGATFGVGMALLPFVFAPILGFGRFVYQGEKPSEPESFKFPTITKKRVAIALSSLLLLFGISVYTTETYEECAKRVEGEFKSTAEKLETGAKGIGALSAVTAYSSGATLPILGSIGIVGAPLLVAATVGYLMHNLTSDLTGFFAEQALKERIKNECSDKKR